MKLLEKILVAFDFTPASQAILDYAMELSKVFHSKVSLIHVLPDDLEHEKVKLFLHETARDKLKAVVGRLKDHGVETGSSMLHYGAPYEHVVRAADTLKVNLVLIGSGAKRKDGKPHLGTTTKRIIQRSEQPVFVVKEGASFRMERILCPVDFSDTSRRALKNAITLARRFQAELIILNVVESPGTGLLASEKDVEREKNLRRARQKSKLTKFLADFKLKGITWEQEIRAGDPSELILEEIARKKIDLLVMGTTGKTGISRWIMGSVAEKVVQEVPCSFVMLKRADVFQLQLESRLQDLDSHFQNARALLEDGYYEEAIDAYKSCLAINSMHVPSYHGLAKVYEAMGDEKQANTYRDMGKHVMDKVWDQKIEEEVRKFYRK